MTRSFLLAAAVACAGCHSRPDVTSCDDDLHGVWVSDNHAQRWMMLDNGSTLEAYPLFDDHVADAAPRVIDLRRGERFVGEVKRRFNRGSAECWATSPVRVAKCKENSLHLVIADPPTPLQFSPCQWPRANEAELDHWHREVP